jgi:hypothetical protein
MGWVKRNLYFLVGAIVALVLMGLAGWYLYSKWQLNNEMLAKLNEQYGTLATLNNQNPHPGSGNVNNIQTAKEQQAQLKDFMAKGHKFFQRIPPIPNPDDKGRISDQEFSTALSRTIDQMQRDATNSSVSLPPQGYSFSFEAQKRRMSFAPGSLAPLSTQLGEIKTICDILFTAKINSLDNLRRERVSPDDSSGPQSDFLAERSATNELAIQAPYEITFRCFSPELASVLAGFASSSNAILVKSLNIELAPAVIEPVAPVVAAPVYTPTPTAPQPQPRRSEEDAFRARYGLGPSRGPTTPTPPPPVFQPQPTPGGPQPVAKGGLQTVLDEKQIKVTMLLHVVKMLPQANKSS